MSPPVLRRYRAERLLRKEFSGQRSKVLAVVRSQLRTKGVMLDPADLEACYAQAWHGLYATVLNGEEVENPSAWLVLVTFRRAIDESRSAGRHTLAGETGVANSFDPDLAAELDDRARLRQVFEGLRTTLSERECEAASLCYLQGLSRAQAAERMGISESRMRKLMEGGGAGRSGIAGKVGELLDTIKAGDWCEQQSSLMRAFAFGVLDPDGERHTLAMVHCRECPACRAHVASLRGLAVVLPLPLLSSLALAGGTGAAAGAGVTGTGTGLARAGATAATDAAREGVGIGGGATSAGWGGLVGSLTAKLAVTAAVLLVAGYAALGSRAHGSQPSSPVPRAGVIRQPVGSGTLSQDPLSTLGPSRPGHSTRRSSTPPVRSSRRTGSAGKATGREFGPERVQSGRAVAPSTSTFASTRPSRTSLHSTREFGIE